MKKPVVFFVCVFVLYMTWTFDHSLWNPDETRDAGIAAEMHRTKNMVVPQLNGVAFLEKPPLYYWACVGVYRLSGRVTAGTTRLPAALFGVLGVLFVFLIGRRLFNARVGFLAAAMLATSSQYFRMSHFAMMDIPLAALVTGALYFYLRGSHLGFAILTVLAFYAKGFLGVLLPGLVVTTDAVIHREGKSLLAYVGVGALLFCGLVFPWFWGLYRAGGMDYLNVFLVDNHWHRFVSNTGDHTEHFWFFYLLSLPVDFLPWSPLLLGPLLGFFRNPHHYWETRPRRFLLVWFVGLMFFFTVSSSKRSIYLLPVFPAFSLLLAVWLDEFFGRTADSFRWEKRFAVVWAVLSLLIVFSSVFVVPQLDRDKTFVPVIDVVRAHTRQKGDVIGYSLSEMERGVFGFYLQQTFLNPTTPAELDALIKKKSHDGYCLVVNRNKMTEIQSVLPTSLRMIYEYRAGKKTRSYRIYKKDGDNHTHENLDH